MQALVLQSVSACIVIGLHMVFWLGIGIPMLHVAAELHSMAWHCTPVGSPQCPVLDGLN